MGLGEISNQRKKNWWNHINNYFFLITFFSTDIDECASAPCVNGRCVDGLASFQCICEPGWTGLLCDIGKFSIYKYKFVESITGLLQVGRVS